MTDWKKDLEKDFIDQLTLLAKHYGDFGVAASNHANAILDVYKVSVAKQRTQLIARVREEVIGEEINILIEVHKRAEKEKRVVVDMKGLLKQLKNEQLKKLEIISEEVK